jgi:5'(3')-deoxyribonucleotidase
MTKKTFYLDMDGVVADWIEGAAVIVGYRMADPNAYYPPEDWEKIKQNQRMFLDLPLMPKANQMANLARRFRDELGYNLMFLTAIPHYNDIPWAFWDKCIWAQAHFSDIPVHFGPYSDDKQKHCLPGDILVDDRPDNCKYWKDSGGVIVHVTNDYDLALQQLQELFDKESV